MYLYNTLHKINVFMYFEYISVNVFFTRVMCVTEWWHLGLIFTVTHNFCRSFGCFFRNVGQPLYHWWGSGKAALPSSCHIDHGCLCQPQGRQVTGRSWGQRWLDTKPNLKEAPPRTGDFMSAQRHWSNTDNGQNRQANQSPLCHTWQTFSSWEAGTRAEKDWECALYVGSILNQGFYWFGLILAPK